jgi:cytidine deaminase
VNVKDVTLYIKVKCVSIVWNEMKYCTVTSYITKGPVIESNSHMCAERQLIKKLYRECLKTGNKPHHFRHWLRRKYGHLTIYRQNIHGDAISLPCILCRKMIERFNICWVAHDGDKWIHSRKTLELPPSVPTAKQKRILGFSSYN